MKITCNPTVKIFIGDNLPSAANENDIAVVNGKVYVYVAGTWWDLYDS